MFKSVLLLALLGAEAALAQTADAASQPYYCGPNQHFEATSNVCPITCANMNQPVTGSCSYANVCVCNAGYVWNNQGVCIKKENCPNICPLNEHFEQNSHKCEISCSILHLEPILGACDTHSACFCNDGYVRNDNGVCIKRENCVPYCGPNQHFEATSNVCPITCDNMNQPVTGSCAYSNVCICNDGYVWNNYRGLCTRRENCPLPGAAATPAQTADAAIQPYCGPNQHFVATSTVCAITCANMNQPVTGACAYSNVCICNDGYVWNNYRGICTKRENCPLPRAAATPADAAIQPYCGPNQHFEATSTVCPITCDNMNQPVTRACAYSNVCVCNDGYVWNNYRGICTKRQNCPNACPLNEHFERNSDRCQISCSILHLEPILRPCDVRSACFCNDGYVRNDNGVCIKRGSCPPRCPPFERYLNQTVQCQITCKNMALEPYMGPCYPSSGCFCLPGYVRNDAGTCIRREECSTTICKKGERYTDCGSSCPETCESRGDTCKACTAQCVPGCFCAGTTIRAPDGTCVEPKNCPPRKCGQNEVFVQCPPTCPRTENCSNIWSRIPCDPIDCCTPSCRCKPGFYRNDQNVCVSSQQCNPYCGPNQHFEATSNVCPITCANMNQPVTGSCSYANVCVCNAGYVWNNQGVCIKRQSCPPAANAGTPSTDEE